MDSGKLLAAGRFCDCNLAINSHPGRRCGSCESHVASSGTDRPGSTIPGGERSASIAPPTPATRTTSTCRFDHPLNAIPSDAPTKRISEPSTTHTNVVCASYAAIGNEIEESARPRCRSCREGNCYPRRGARLLQASDRTSPYVTPRCPLRPSANSTV